MKTVQLSFVKMLLLFLTFFITEKVSAQVISPAPTYKGYKVDIWGKLPTTGAYVYAYTLYFKCEEAAQAFVDDFNTDKPGNYQRASIAKAPVPFSIPTGIWIFNGYSWCTDEPYASMCYW